MMDFESVTAEVAKLGTMKFFPSDPAVKLALVEFFGDIAENEDQVRWLVKRVRTLYHEWPGEHELRAAFCSKFRPKDGINAYSQVYLDGIPSEKASEPQLGPGRPAGLLEGPKDEHPITDERVKRRVSQLAAAMPKMPSAAPVGGAFEKRLKEAMTAPQDRPPLPPPTPQVITQADIDRAVAELHAAKQPADFARLAAGDREE